MKDNNKGQNLLVKFTHMREFTILVLLVAICVVMSILSPTFATSETVVNILYNISTTGILAIGMTVALISGGFDLSVGAVVALTGIIASQLFIACHMNEVCASLIGIAVAIGVGAANGFFITKLKLSSFIVTLAMAGIARGAVFVISRGSTLSVTSMNPDFLNVGNGKLGIFPNIGIIFIVLAVIFDILLRKSKIFRKVYYSGSNETAARMSGINTNKTKFWVFVFVAGLAGVAGILSMMRFSMMAPTYAEGMELTVISAAVIGGCSLNGGEGTILGAVLGVVLLAIASSSMTLLGISAFWQQLITSLILLIAVTVDAVSENMKSKKLLN